jgi:hypothetical protein
MQVGLEKVRLIVETTDPDIVARIEESARLAGLRIEREGPWKKREGEEA